MKMMVMLLLLLLTGIVRAQEVAVCVDQTVTIIFPMEVCHVDRGNENVLVQLVPEAKQVLLVKARTVQMAPTNLTAVTKDGNVYVFHVVYTDSPIVYIVQAALPGIASLADQCRQLQDRSMILPSTTDLSNGMSVQLAGLFIRDQYLFLQLRWRNESPLDYPVSQLRIYISDQRRAQRTAVQEINVAMISSNLLPALVTAHSFSQSVIAVPVRSLARNQRLVIELQEREGSRTLRLAISPKLLLQAERLPPL